MSEYDQLPEEPQNGSSNDGQQPYGGQQPNNGQQPNDGQQPYGGQQPPVQQYPPYGYPPYPMKPQTNTIGLVALICTGASFVLLLIPIIGLISIVLGPVSFILSIVGVTKKPRTLAVIALCLHLFGILLLFFGILGGGLLGVLSGL